MDILFGILYNLFQGLFIFKIVNNNYVTLKPHSVNCID